MQRNSIAGFSFDTDALPERDRFPAFCEEVVRNVVGVDICRLASGPFRGVVAMHRVGDVTILDFSATDGDLHRTTSNVRDGNSDIVVALWRAGSASVSQSENEH